MSHQVHSHLLCWILHIELPRRTAENLQYLQIRWPSLDYNNLVPWTVESFEPRPDFDLWGQPGAIWWHNISPVKWHSHRILDPLSETACLPWTTYSKVKASYSPYHIVFDCFNSRGIVRSPVPFNNHPLLWHLYWVWGLWILRGSPGNITPVLKISYIGPRNRASLLIKGHQTHELVATYSKRMVCGRAAIRFCCSDDAVCTNSWCWALTVAVPNKYSNG